MQMVHHDSIHNRGYTWNDERQSRPKGSQAPRRGLASYIDRYAYTVYIELQMGSWGVCRVKASKWVREWSCKTASGVRGSQVGS